MIVAMTAWVSGVPAVFIFSRCAQSFVRLKVVSTLAPNDISTDQLSEVILAGLDAPMLNPQPLMTKDCGTQALFD